jgi:hypothetical protein
MHTLGFVLLSLGLWLSPVGVIVLLVRIGRRFEIDLRRQSPPDDIDYRKW